jgi:hypothetical protein
MRRIGAMTVGLLGSSLALMLSGGASTGASGAAPRAKVVAPVAGYVLAAADGGVFAFGRAFHGSAARLKLRSPVEGIASTPDAGGYWLAAGDGGVFAFGNARFYGSMAAKPLDQPVVGIAATPDGRGYWLVGSDGGVFAFGKARFFGSLAATHVLSPIVGIATTGDGMGYWLMTDTGEAFAFGDALAKGAPPALQAPFSFDYVGIAHVAGTTRGIVLVRMFGARVAFDAAAAGCASQSPGLVDLYGPVVGIAMPKAGCGAWLAGSDGGVFALGVAFRGSASALPLAKPIVGIAS